MTDAAPPPPTTPPPTAADPQVPHLPPQMAPRRRRAILIVLWIVFALWVAALLAMYFGEVYPRRHPKAGRPAGQAMITSTPPFSGSPEGARSGGRSVPLRGYR